jgi:hypothetical protein
MLDRKTRPRSKGRQAPMLDRAASVKVVYEAERVILA